MSASNSHRQVKANYIQPLHPADDTPRLKQLIQSLRDNGWQERPIIVNENNQAVTGSHRIAAANELIDEMERNWDQEYKFDGQVPVIEISNEAYVACLEAMDDYDRYQILKEMEPEVAEIMAQEPGI